MSHLETLLSRISDRQAVIGIVGLGYVGQPLALRYAGQGFAVLGFDINAPRVAELNSGRSSIEHIDDAAVAGAVAAGFEATTEFARIAQTDAVILCVPTPLNAYREPDLSFVTATCDAIAPYLRAGQVLSLESTTFPGTTDEEVLPRATQAGLKVGRDIFIVYSPEREDPGNARFTTADIPKIVGGVTPDCLTAGRALYAAAIDRVVPVSSTRAAEMTKLLENIHRAVNIGLVNEMKVVADAMGIDIHEVIDAAATKPFGFTPFYPGPGLGGHCIPIDPYYLTWKARAYGLNTRFIELSGEVNRAMPDFVLGKLVSALNDRGRALKGARVAVLGLAYKKNVDDLRESPSIEIMEKLAAGGAVLSYSDPHIAAFPKMRKHWFDLQSLTLSPEVLAGLDAVVIATDHDRFDFEMIRTHAPLIIDARGVYRTPADHIVPA